MLWNLPDDGQNTETCVDDKWIHSVLRFLFALKINTDIDTLALPSLIHLLFVCEYKRIHQTDYSHVCEDDKYDPYWGGHSAED